MMLSTLNNAGCAQQPVASFAFDWQELPALPDKVGFAGSFGGVSNRALLVAGGANFPDGGAPWTGSTKVWYDRIFVLENRSGQWQEAEKLPRPLGYGVSVSWRGNLIVVGGSNVSGHFADVFMLQYKDGKITTEPLPALPKPNANACGALVGNIIYIAGGLEKPDAKTTESSFWALDLTKPSDERQWEILPTWPGSSRMLSVAGAKDGSFYLFSGTQLVAGKREYLKDAYKYTPGNGWTKIADVPEPMVAAPSPAYVTGDNLIVFGGDDGKYAATAATLKERHPGFSKNIWQYNTQTNTWANAGNIYTQTKNDAATNPNGSIWAPVTTPLVTWQNNVVLPGGEVRPATRTPRILVAIPEK